MHEVCWCSFGVKSKPNPEILLSKNKKTVQEFFSYHISKSHSLSHGFVLILHFVMFICLQIADTKDIFSFSLEGPIICDQILKQRNVSQKYKENLFILYKRLLLNSSELIGWEVLNNSWNYDQNIAYIINSISGDM